MIQSLANIIFPKSSEIGSDFPLDITVFNSPSEYYQDYLVTTSGRACIKLMIDHTQGPFLLPNYLCSSILDQFQNVDYDYYDLNDQLQIILEKLTEQIKSNKYRVLFMIDYFGIVDRNLDNILALCKEYKILVVEDFTHRPFDLENLYGDITLCSIRKTLAIPYGGIIRDKQNLLDYRLHKRAPGKYTILYTVKTLAMILKNINCLKPIWRPILVYCEKWLDSLPVMCGVDFVSQFLLSRFDHQAIKQKRLQNYKYLQSHLFSQSLPSNDQEGYFMYPLVFPDQQTRDQVRKKLIDNRIYPAIHWDNPINHFCNRVLSIPIDQRYNQTDMKRIVQLIQHRETI
jgi:hypothetical protein